MSVAIDEDSSLYSAVGEAVDDEEGGGMVGVAVGNYNAPAAVHGVAAVGVSAALMPVQHIDYAHNCYNVHQWQVPGWEFLNGGALLEEEQIYPC